MFECSSGHTQILIQDAKIEAQDEFINLTIER
jgi:hypothetical protein